MRRLRIILAAVWMLYLVGANALINSKFLLGQINSWNDGHVAYQWAFTPFPGVVWARRFYLAHEDSNVRWNARFDWVQAFVSPVHLAFSQLRASMIRVSEGRFYFIEKKHLANPEMTMLLPQV